jgi:glycosyltransferase involved in cell wall biosynthesis
VVLSVVMITYNHEKYLKQAIEGVLSQEVDFSFELIIADDNSLDGTSKVINDLIEKHPKGHLIQYYKHPNNKGMSGNFLWALQKAKGKYIALCDGDDYWIDPLKSQKQVDFLERHEEFGLVHTNNQVFIQENLRFSTLPRSIVDSDELFEHLIFKSNPICTLTVCLRAEILSSYINSLKLPDELYLLSDYPIWLWVSLKSKIKLLNEVTGVYRILNESASQSIDPGRKVVFVENVKKQALFFLEKEREDEYKLAFYRKYALLYSRYVEKEYKKSIMQLFLKKKKYLDFVRFVLLGFLSPSNPAIKVIDKFHIIYNC